MPLASSLTITLLLPRATPTVSLWACAAIGALMAPAITAMASILFRMVNSFAMMHAGFAPAHNPFPIHRARHRSPKKLALYAAIFGIFCRPWNPLKPQASAIVEPRMGIKCWSRFDFPHASFRRDFHDHH